MRRDDALGVVTAAAQEHQAQLFCGNGNVARALSHLFDSPAFFYMVGSMGLCASIAAGYASRRGGSVISVEGDANFLMGLSGLPAVARATRERTFVHVVLDNGICETTGGQATLSGQADFCEIALAVGYERAEHLAPASPEQLEALLGDAFEKGGRSLLRVDVTPGLSPRHPRVALHPAQIAERFRK